MIKYFFLALTWLMTASAFAAGDRPIFADIKWGTDVSSARAQLTAKGFKTEIDSDGDLKFTGKLMGYPAVGFGITPSNKLHKVVVILATPDHKAREAYNEMKAVLIKKYGQPTNEYEFFSKPYYDGDGYEEQAIKLGKARFAIFWDESLFLEITDKLAVKLTYESPDWASESSRRKNRATEVF